MREYVMGEVPQDVVPPVVKQKKRRAVRVPPLQAGKAIDVRDKAYTEEDARRHAALIEEVWRRAGHRVVPVVTTQIRGGKRCWLVQMPDLVNGLPASVYYGRRKT